MNKIFSRIFGVNIPYSICRVFRGFPAATFPRKKIKSYLPFEYHKQNFTRPRRSPLKISHSFCPPPPPPHHEDIWGRHHRQQLQFLLPPAIEPLPRQALAKNMSTHPLLGPTWPLFLYTYISNEINICSQCFCSYRLCCLS
jgi:hypothetical protein